MRNPKTPTLEQLAKKDAAIAEARERSRAIQADAQQAAATAARAREELIEAFASGDQALEAKLTKTKLAAEARAGEPWRERIAGADRAANRLQGERDAWVAEHIDALLEEVKPDARAATEGITAAVVALEAARKRWHEVEQRVTTLIRPTRLEVHEIPGISVVDQLIRDLRRGIGIGDVPAPLPRPRVASGGVLPEHDPDPQIRDVARARIAAEDRIVAEEAQSS